MKREIMSYLILSAVLILSMSSVAIGGDREIENYSLIEEFSVTSLDQILDTEEQIQYLSDLDINPAVSLIYSYVDAVNIKDIDGYISLFTKWNQEQMRLFVEFNSKSDFFQESRIDLVNIKELVESKDLATNISAECEMYEDVVVFCTEENIILADDATVNSLLENNYNYRVYVVVKENGEWKIERGSTPAIHE